MSDAVASRIDDPARISALRRPGYVGALLAFRLLFAWLAARPFASLARGVTGSWPEGDALLFEPGGVMLLEAIRLRAAALGPVLEQAAWIVVLSWVLGLVPLGAFLFAASREGPMPAAAATERAVDRMGTLASLLGLSVLAQTLVAAPVLVGGRAVADALARGHDLKAQLGRGAAVLVALLAVAVVRTAHDLARAAAVRDRLSVAVAASRSLAALRARPLGVTLAYLGRTAAGALLVALAAVATSHVDVTGAAGGLAVALLHAAVLAALVGLRASWLAAALRAVVRTARRERPSLGAGGEGPVEAIVAAGRPIPGDVAAHDAPPERGPAG